MTAIIPATDAEWIEACAWGYSRFLYMFEAPPPEYVRLNKQADRDRTKFAQTYLNSNRWDRVLLLEFLVSACGIPYLHAETYVVSQVAYRQKHGPTMFGEIFIDEKQPPEGLARRAPLVLGGIIPAIAWARLHNQARKGTSGQPFWNEVLRLMRTERVAPFKSVRRATELDRRDIAKADLQNPKKREH